MHQRVLAILLFVLLLAIGGGLPKVLHLHVDHNCCGGQCAASETHRDINAADHASGGCTVHRADSADSGGAAAEIMIADAGRADEGEFSDSPLEGDPSPNDCPVCQFLATLAAVVAAGVVTPVHLEPLATSATLPVSADVPAEPITSRSPRAPPAC
jgi:hypothetical protein